MSVYVNPVSPSPNTISGSTLSDLIMQIDAINSFISAGNQQDKAAQKIAYFYADLQQGAPLDLANLTDQSKITAAQNAMAPVALATQGKGSISSALSANQASISTALTALRNQLVNPSTGALGVTLRTNTSDMVFYQYSRAGEAGLNVQLGQLGDAIDSLNQAVTQLNRIEGILAISPGQNFVDDRGELLSYYSTTANANASGAPTDPRNSSIFFNSVTQFQNAELVPGSTTQYNNAIGVLKDTMTQLTSVMNQFTPGSDQYQAMQKVVNMLSGYGVAGWNSTNPPTFSAQPNNNWFDTNAPDANAGDEFYASNPSVNPKNFIRLFNDGTFRKAVSDALSTSQSQNDVQQQNLRKSQFLYEEFVKSAGDIMDRIYQAIQNIIQKIAQ